MSKVKVLIDNGHGEETPGKRSPDGKFREYIWTREIAAIIKSELIKRGYDAELLVPETKDISLVERVRRANAACNKYGAKNVILVSVHCNAAGMGDKWMNARGWSAWTTRRVTLSDNLANCLYKAAFDIFGKERVPVRADYSDGDPDWESNFYILRNAKCCAVLTENFFQDNKEDVKYLESQAGKDACVRVHVFGIIDYINKYLPGK